MIEICRHDIFMNATRFGMHLLISITRHFAHKRIIWQLSIVFISTVFPLHHFFIDNKDFSLVSWMIAPSFFRSWLILQMFHFFWWRSSLRPSSAKRNIIILMRYQHFKFSFKCILLVFNSSSRYSKWNANRQSMTCFAWTITSKISNNGINSSKPHGGRVHHEARPSSVQVMVCRLFGAKSSSELILACC